MGGINRIIDKINAIVEGKVNTVLNNEFINKSHVEFCINNGIDLYNRQGPEYELLPYSINNINLSYLDEFIKKYPYFVKQ